MPKGEKTVNNGVKSNPAEMKLRIEEAARWMYENPSASWTDFIDHFKAKWGIAKNTVNLHRKKALKKLDKLIDENLGADRKMGIVKLHRMYNRAIEDGNDKHALEVLKELNKIQGLHTTKTDITTDGKKVNRLSLTELVAFSKSKEEDGKAED